MKSNIRKRQFEICGQTLKQLCVEVFENERPLDLEVKKLFREHKSWGGKDRRFYSETIYSFFRWFGWLKPCEALDSDESWLKATELAFELSTTESCEEAEVIFKQHYPTQEFQLESLVPAGLKAEFNGTDEAFIAWIKQQQSRPPVWLRCRQKGSLGTIVNGLKEMGLEVEAHKTVTTAIKVVGRFNIQLLPSYKSGLVEVQDFASQCIGTVAEPKAEQKWLDACAGTGGKALQLCDIRRGQGATVAVDIRSRALEELTKRFRKAKIKQVKTKVHDLAKKPFGTEKFDGVLVDAPCSNSGTWRRNPALRWNFSLEKVAEVADLQLKILTSASASVKVGGVLVYSTCSVCKQENEGVIQAFLESNPEFEGVSIKHPITRAKQQTSMALPSTLANNDTMFVAKFKRV